MPKYHVYGAVGATMYLGEYEASSEDDAIRQAEASGKCGTPGLCHQCSDELSLGDLYDLTAELDEKRS
jgi:hypothetical protein